MADLTGRTEIFEDDTSVVSSYMRHPLGTKAFDTDGNEYIYLLGIGSTAAGSWVTFDEAHVTALASSNAKGRLAIAMAAIVANKYGWYQIYGKNVLAKGASGSIDDNDFLYLTSTGGTVDDTDVAGDAIIGAIARSADSSGVFTVELNYPWVGDTAID